HARAGIHPRRHLYLKAPHAYRGAETFAGGAGLAGELAGTLASRARLRRLQLHHARGAVVRLLERDLHRMLEVLALACARLRPPAPTATAEDVAEAVAQVEVVEVDPLGGRGAAAGSGRTEPAAGAVLALRLLDLVRHLPAVAVLVVLLPLLGVLQDLVCVIDL